MPWILAGNNVLLTSPTGSGKTEAVVAPVAERALDVPGDTYCLYICPTRALVNDVERRIEVPLHKLGMRVGVRHGDRKTLRGKTIPNILITTPESLDVMLGSENAKDRNRLLTIRVVVVDEVHQFYQSHRGYQLVLLLERLKRLTQAPIQRLLLSATVAEPERMATWFQGSDRPFEIVQVPGGRALQVILDRCSAGGGEEFRQGDAVVELVRCIIHEHRKVLLFANSRNECDWLYWKLHDRLGIETFLHYSTLDKKYRENVERRFERANRALCIATSTLELGIDIGDIDAVVMYGAPASISSFVQRVGRGSRRSGTCVVYGICRDYHIDGSELGAEHDLLMLYALVASMLDSELEARPETQLFSVHVQQFFSLAYQYHSVIVELLHRVVTSAEQLPFATKEDLIRILSNLAYSGFFNHRVDTDEYYPAEKWEWVKRSLQLWGNIATRFYDTVVDAIKEIPLSQVPRGKAQEGRVFLLAGEPRIVTEVTGSLVKTVQLSIEDPSLIIYETMGAATPPEVTHKASELLQKRDFPDLPVEVDLSLEGLLREYRERFRSFDFKRYVPVARIQGRYCYYTFGGTWANEILAIVLQDRDLSAEADSWRVYSNQPIPPLSELPSEIADLANLVLQNLPSFVRRMAFSYHFYQLPDDLKHKEVCSLLDLRRLRDWFAELRWKEVAEIPPPVSSGHGMSMLSEPAESA